MFVGELPASLHGPLLSDGSCFYQMRTCPCGSRLPVAAHAVHTKGTKNDGIFILCWSEEVKNTKMQLILCWSEERRTGRCTGRYLSLSRTHAIHEKRIALLLLGSTVHADIIRPFSVPARKSQRCAKDLRSSVNAMLRFAGKPIYATVAMMTVLPRQAYYQSHPAAPL